MFSLTPKTYLGLPTAVSLLVLQANPALAFDPTGNPVADTFLTLLETEDGTVDSYGSFSESGDTVTIANIVLKQDGTDDEQVTIGATTLTGGEVLGNGRLKLAGLTLESLELMADDGGMTLASMAATDLLLPSPAEIEGDGSSIDPSYKTFEALDIQITDVGNQVAGIASITSTIDGMDGDQPTSGSFAVSGILLDVAKIQAEEAKSLQELGYDTLSLNVSGSGKWEPDAGTLVIPDLKISGENAATLSLSLSLGGVTRDVVDQLNASADNPEESLGILQGISIAGVTIRLDDSSLTGRILDQEAKKAGVDTSQYVAGLTSSLPLMLGMLQNKDLEAQVAGAVTEYLNAPGSLEITVAPAAPVPMAQIMGTVMIAPQMIPQILSLGITANQ